MKNNFIFPLCAVFALIITSAISTGCRPQSAVSVPVPTRTLHLGNPAPAGTAFDILAHRIKEYVETRSNGRYNILVYPDATLGHQEMIIQAMVAGTVDLAIVNSAAITQFAEELGVLDLPFLFSDWDEVLKFLHSDIIGEIYSISDAAGISTLAFMPRGFRHTINNRGPITVPSDFADLRIRVLRTPVFMDTFTALGANPQGIPWEGTFAALQEGRVEGKENTIVTINDYNFHEIQRYLSMTGHFFAFAGIIASPIMLSSIPAEDEELIRRAVFDAALSLGVEQLADENVALANLQTNGMQINEIPDKQPFIDMMEPVYNNFFRTHSRKYYDMIRNAIK